MSLANPAIPRGWQLGRLDDVILRIEAGVSFKALDRPAEQGELGVVKVSCATWGDFLPGGNKALLPGCDPGDCPRISKGDLLISRANTVELVCAVVMVEDDYPNLLLSDKILRLVPRLDRADPRFLLYAMRTPAVRGHLEGHATGTSGSMRNVSQENMRTCPVPLPPLSEQRRIAAILDKADAIRRKRQEALRLTDQFLCSAFLEMFGDPLKNSKGWPTEKLGDVATLDRGRSCHRPRDASFLYGGPYPFIQTGEIANSDGYITSYTKTYSEQGLAQSRLWPTGTLCITIAANIAKTSVLTFDACFPDSVVGLVPGDQLTTEYVRYWFVAMEKAIDALATQVAQKNINLQILQNLEIRLPPRELQDRFSTCAGKTRELRAGAVQACEEAGQLFSSLVQRAFRGQL